LERYDSARAEGYNPSVSRQRNPVRLVLALSVAAILAVFLLYTSVASDATPMLEPSALLGRSGETVLLGGIVVGPIEKQHMGASTVFSLRDIHGRTRIRVAYSGSVPDLFARGREVLVRGKVRKGVFVAEPDSLVTKCPSKYVPKRRQTGG
jgi:cytochrome c-type biogenesis protein CcmE